MYEDAISIYADKTCKVKIDSIQLGKDISLKTLTGEIVDYKNIVEMGSKPLVEVYLKNETNARLVIQDISCSDTKVKIKVSNDKLNAYESTLVRITMEVPEMTIETAKAFLSKERNVFIKAYLIIQ